MEELFYNKYKKDVMIGRGASAEVWRVTDLQTGVTQALKIYNPAVAMEEDGLELMRHEFALMANLNHQNLLRPSFFDIWENTPFLVLPYCKNGNLAKKKGAFSDEDAWKLLRDVGSGLAYLHRQDPPVIHQDIKPENILIGDDGTFMLTDFGVSAHAKVTMRRTISSKLIDVGTMAYMAPEKFGKNKELIILSDIWSLGAMTYEMVSGEVPFCVGTVEGGVLQMNGAAIPDLPETVPAALRETIYKCLSLNPWDRPQAAEVEATARIALGEERKSILPFPAPEPKSDSSEKKDGSENDPPKPNPWRVIVAVAAVLVIVLIALYSSVVFGVISPQSEENVNVRDMSHIASMLKDGSKAQEGLRLLQELVDKQDPDATYLMSRLYFKSKKVGDYCPDSVMLMQQTAKIKIDNSKAYDLLVQSIRLNPKNYQALYELGCDYYAGELRTDAVQRDTTLKKPEDFFCKALDLAQKADDVLYIDRINEMLKLIRQEKNAE